MEHFIAFIIYLSLFRIAIIASGIFSIYLGYRLFAMGVFPQSSSTNPSPQGDVSAEFAGAKFSLRNAAPGTSFALFGAVIISAMVITGAPEVTIESLENGVQKATFRNNAVEDMPSFAQQALAQLERGEKTQAQDTVRKALKNVAAPLNDFAWVLLQSDDMAVKAEHLAEIAVSVEPQNPDFLDTLAQIQYKNGDKAKAIQTLETAQAINPVFTEKLNKWRN